MIKKIIKKLDKLNYPYELINDEIHLFYTCDMAQFKIAKGIGIGNGSDGRHKIVISKNYPKEAEQTMIKMDSFSFYKYDLDEKPLFTIKGFALLFEKLDRNYFHDYFHITVT